MFLGYLFRNTTNPACRQEKAFPFPTSSIDLRAIGLLGGKTLVFPPNLSRLVALELDNRSLL